MDTTTECIGYTALTYLGQCHCHRTKRHSRIATSLSCKKDIHPFTIRTKKKKFQTPDPATPPETYTYPEHPMNACLPQATSLKLQVLPEISKTFTPTPKRSIVWLTFRRLRRIGGVFSLGFGRLLTLASWFLNRRGLDLCRFRGRLRDRCWIGLWYGLPRRLCF